MYLSKEIRSKIKKIQIKTDRMANEILSGEYKSAFRGRGLNFDNLREYYPGDEIRNIDWKVTARSSKPYVRQYKEERQLSIFLVLDMSASNNFGTHEQSKNELAVELAAVLASLAIKNNDKVGMILFTDEIELYVPLKQGKAHIFKLIRELLNFRAKSKKTNIKSALAASLKLIPRHSVVFLISDFLPALSEDFDEYFNFKTELKVARRALDLVAMSVRDSREFELPNIGYIEVVNPESGHKELLNLNNSSVRQNFANAQQHFFNKLKNEFKLLGVDFLDLKTSQSYVPQLLSLFLRREKRS